MNIGVPCMWPGPGKKWCEDNSVVPFVAIAVSYDF